MKGLLPFVTLALASTAIAFPAHGSLAGLSEEELERILPTLEVRAAEPPPGPLADPRSKLVNDRNHRWRPTGRNDIRGVCPGLNTLASHGVCNYTHCLKLARFLLTQHVCYSGFLATELRPLRKLSTLSKKAGFLILNDDETILTRYRHWSYSVPVGMNMGNNLAVFLAYAALLVDGNVVTNQLSIGGKTPRTGPDPPAPALVGGLNTHDVLEGGCQSCGPSWCTHPSPPHNRRRQYDPKYVLSWRNVLNCDSMR